MSGDVDLLVGAYGWASDHDARVEAFVRGLKCKCNLSGVCVIFSERLHRPMSAYLRGAVRAAGHEVRTCPVPPQTNSREDASLFADWMVENGTGAPWFIVSHFDVSFLGDYVGYVRSMMRSADMVGEHHNGIVAVRRAAYDDCRVGFCGIDNASMKYDGVRILPPEAPGATGGCPIQSLDVGELLSLRMSTLGYNHVWLRRAEEWGKSDLFDHLRNGSDHEGGPR